MFSPLDVTTFISTSLIIGMHVDTYECLAGEVLLRIWEIRTRNRLEHFHGKVKAYLHPNMTLSNCVDELLLLT